MPSLQTIDKEHAPSCQAVHKGMGLAVQSTSVAALLASLLPQPTGALATAACAGFGRT